MCKQCSVNQKTPSMTRDAILMRRKRLLDNPQHPVKHWSPTWTCTKCSEVKLLSEFTKRSGKQSNGKICKTCKVGYRNSPRGRAANMIAGSKKRALSKGFDFDLTPDWVIERLEKGVCEVTGIQLELGGGKLNGGYRPYTPSLDRTDPTKGYTKDNVKVVCWIYNSAKGSGSHNDVMKLARALTNV